MKKRWSYKVIKYSNGYRCDVYHLDKKIDFHDLERKKWAENIGKDWVKWLKRCDKVLRYEPKKYPKWLDWYSRTYGCAMYPSLYYFDKEIECSLLIPQKRF